MFFSHLSVYWISMSVCLSVCLLVYHSVHLSVCLSICPLGYRSVSQYVCLSCYMYLQVLSSGMKCLNDFLFLGSSSLIAACGDASDNKSVFFEYPNICRIESQHDLFLKYRNLILWDTLLPNKRSVVKG